MYGESDRLKNEFTQIGKRFMKFAKMKPLFLSCIFFSIYISYGQKPPTGTYTYQMVWAEHNGMLGPKVSVKIKGDSIYVYAMDSSKFHKKGDLIEKGILIFHQKSRKWIIATKPEDKDALDAGGCSEGPTVIDFKNKWYWQC